MAELQCWLVLGRDENGDEIDGPWWPLYRAGPPIHAKSAENAIRQARERLPFEDVWVEFVAVPLDLWTPAQ